MKSLILHNGVLEQAELDQLLINDEAYPEKAVYTSFRTYGGKAFRLDEHLIRLLSSARQLGFTLQWPIEKIRLMVHELLKASPHDPQFVKIVATPTNLFAISRQLEIDHQIYRGVSVEVVAYERDRVKAKSIPDVRLSQAYDEAEKQGHHDLLLLNKSGKLTEGSRSNLLWIRDRSLYWCDDALSGITQGAVLEWVRESSLDLQIEESDGLLLDELDTLDELFLTQTSRGVVPIIQVGETRIGEGCVGPLTQQIMKLFHQHILQLS